MGSSNLLDKIAQMFALIDCNNFYASCERVFRPDLVGKPICVLSNNDGCVIARSNEARAIGVPMAAPLFEWKKFFDQNGVHVFSGNFSLYGDMSNRVMTILGDFSPEMEVYSIDEIFLRFSDMEALDPIVCGTAMREKVQQWTGLPISVGFGPTKALAKLANRIAKKFPQLDNVYAIDSEEKRLKALKWLPIADVWGIGRKHAVRLKKEGVKTAYDFTQLDDLHVRKSMAVIGLRLKHDLEGKPTLQLEDVQPKRNIATTRSFDTNYTELEQLRERVSSFAVACGEKLRQQQSDCSSIMVFIHTNRYQSDLPQYSNGIVVRLPFPTNSNIELSKFALQALEKIFRPGYSYKKAGVIVQDLTPTNQRQVLLFENSDPRHAALMHSIDRINKHFGQQKVRLASQDLKRIWKMRQDHLSRRYTTNFAEILTIKA